MSMLDPALRREVQAYLNENNASKEERDTVWQMVREGYDHLSNPWYYAFDGGILMDLVAALRFDRDLMEWFDSLPPEEQEELRSGGSGPSMEEEMAKYFEEIGIPAN